jgi:radical SAM superfamily enzyme YgiQ (UPF0313 family)
MRVKFILPSLMEARHPMFRPIKYSLFPPLGLATLAAFLDPEDEVEIVDQHVQALRLDDEPDLVGIEVYITNAYRAYAIADAYRARGVRVILGGLHVTSLPEEAAAHADAIFLGPAEATFPEFLRDLKQNRVKARYVSAERTLENVPPPRRDLIRRSRYLVPNSLVVTRGCPHHCDFCYKDAFFQGGKSFYVQKVEDALAEIARLPGRHLYFLDDHLLGHKRFAHELFRGMRGMNRVFQGAATVQSILGSNLIEEAAEAGLRSVFVGFETLNPDNLAGANKHHNLGQDYAEAVRRLHDLGIMINGSFVFGLDSDGPDVFRRTVDWAVNMGITTATFHIATPYPGTGYYARLEREGRINTRDWNLYDTRHVVFETQGMSAAQLEAGYHQAYRDFYRWSNIARAAFAHDSPRHRLKHLAYTAGWKKFEPLWNLIIQLRKLNAMTPLLEAVLAKLSRPEPDTAGAEELADATAP